MLQSLLSDFEKLADPVRAAGVSRFFKTGEGQYGEGDIFIGITVPTLRTLSKTYKTLSLTDIHTLMISQIHEHRVVALFILTIQYEKAIKQNNLGLQQEIVFLYLQNKAHINNRDLVDLSAPNILGRSILEAIIANGDVIPASPVAAGIHSGDPAKILHTLSHSASLRDRRIAIISTFTLLKAGFYDDTLAIAETLLYDKHDLIHKAVGRMLRELGKRCKPVEDEFLLKHYKRMPRTMLRYAIEKYPEDERLKWLRGEM